MGSLYEASAKTPYHNNNINNNICLICIVFIVFYLLAQTHTDNFHVKNDIIAVSGMCIEHKGHHNENTNACSELIKRL